MKKLKSHIKKPNKNFKKSISFIWLISYLVIFFLPFISSMIVHFEAIDILSEQSTQIAEQVINLEQREIEQLYDVCNRTYVSILENPIVISAMGMSIPEDFSTVVAYELKSDLSRMILDQNYIFSDVWLIFNHIDFAVSTQRAESLSNFFAAENDGLKKVVEPSIVRDDYKGSLLKIKNGFAYFRTIGYSANGGKPINIVLTISESKLRERYRQIMPQEAGIMILCNSENELIFSSVDISENFIEQISGVTESTEKIRIDGEKYIVSSSTLYNVKYVYLLHEKIMTQPLKVLKMNIVITAIFSIFVGLITISFMVKKNIKPVNDIMHMLGSNSYEQNEYDIIKHRINMQNKEKSNLSSKIDSFKPLAINNLIHSLVVYGDMDRYIMNHLEIRLDRRYFILSEMDIANMGIFSEDSDEELMENNQRLMVVAITNIFTELLEPFGNVYCGLLQDRIVMIINTDNKKTNDICEVMSHGCNLIKHHFKITSRVSLSEEVLSIEELPSVYRLIREQIEDMQILDVYGAQICNSNELKHNETLRNDKKNVFINYIFDADPQNAVSVLRDVLNLNIPKETLKYFIADMFADAIKELSRKSNCEISGFEIINKIMEAQRIQSIENKLEEYTEKLCKMSCVTSDGVEAKVHELINNDYTNPELNITVIASNFQITPAYLSYKFREKYHINILDYIGKLRIEHAKRLLLETDGTIEEIYQQCGYVSRATFLRQFKKYTELNPGKFRQLYS